MGSSSERQENHRNRRSQEQEEQNLVMIPEEMKEEPSLDHPLLDFQKDKHPPAPDCRSKELDRSEGPVDSHSDKPDQG